MAACLLLGGLGLPAVADPGSDGDGAGTPSKAEVDAAKDAVSDQADSVEAVRTELLRANQNLEAAAIRAAQAAEAFNAARWRLREARAAARAAVRRQQLADRDLARQQRLFDEVVAFSYESGLEMSALSTLSEGIEKMARRSDATYQVTGSMSDIKDDYEAALEMADLAGDQAEEAREAAAALASQAAAARAAAQAEADWAAAQAERIAERKHRLLAQLAQLQDISVGLATRRQAALEAQVQAEAAAAAQAQAQAESEQEQGQQPDQPQPGQPDQPQPDQPQTDQPQPDQPQPDQPDQPQPDQPQPDPAPPTGNAAAAISFARAQLGEPYRWGAAGPDAWDCSGLTMRAWQAGGRSLPHYSAGQYDAATPVGVGQLRPGDLVFWGSSNDPRSIFHVALYLGDHRIIHAPRTGRPVTEDSMYYWTPPTFFARP